MQDLGIRSDGALLLRDGMIQRVGTTSQLEALAESRAALDINATGKVVMPGFVDCHTHLMFPALQTGNPGAVHEIDRAAHELTTLTAQRLAGRGRTYLRTMARHGTTTLEAKSGCGPNESAELKVLRVLKVLGRRPLDVLPTFLFRLGSPADRRRHTDAAAAEMVFGDLMFKIRRRRLARFADLQWDTDPARRPWLVRFLDTALSLGFALKIHADQHGAGAAIFLALEYCVTSIDHLEHATVQEACRLAGTPTIAVLLPCSSFRQDRYAPARAMIDEGVAVALGSNFNPQLSPSLNMQTAISLACLQMKMTPEEAIGAATLNAAHALRIASRVGSLAIDKQADVLILDTSDYRDLAYSLGTNLVQTTIKKGEIL